MRIESLRDLLSQFPDIDGFWDFDDLLQTESRIKEAVAIEESARGAKQVELLTQLARVQGLIGNLSESSTTLLLASELLSNPTEAGSLRAKVRFLIEQGRYFGLSMNSSQSISHFVKAWELTPQLNKDFFTIEAAVMLSITQPPKFQNEWLKRALKLAEETSDEQAKLWLTQLYVMDGWHLFDFRKFEEALGSFEKALARPQITQNPTRILRIKWSMARTLRALNRINEALDLQKTLLGELNTVGKVNGHVYLELGECFQLLKNNEESKNYFELAYKELSLNGWYADNKSLELSRIQHLSKKK